jgi:hypothetical protein
MRADLIAKQILISLLILPNLMETRHAEAATLSGAVKDLGAASSVTEGIGGVRIKIKDEKSKEIAQGLTDAKGQYKIDFPATSGKLTADYEKLGYQSRPTTRKIQRLNGDQEPVFMVQEAASTNYYQTVAKSASRLSGDNLVIKLEIIAIVEHLPRREQYEISTSATGKLKEAISFKNKATRKDIDVADPAGPP